MGRNPKVPHHEAIACIQKNIQYFKTNNFPSTTHHVWTQMHEDLGKRWTPHSVYTHVTENKNGNLAAARQLCGISTSPPTAPKTKKKPDIRRSKSLDTSSPRSDDESSAEVENYDPKADDYHLLLTEQDWDIFKPDPASPSTQKRLKPGVWANVISNRFWLTYNMPCAMIAKWSAVKNEEDGSFTFTFRAVCKSTKCGNVFIGTAEKYPGTGKLHLNIRARDTRQDLHEVVSRPLNGSERGQVGEQLLRQKPTNYRNKLLRDGMEFGEPVPPTIRRGYIYRQAKMEAGKKHYGIPSGEKIDMLTILRDLSTGSKYRHIIHDVGMNPVHIIYCTPEQVYVYKEYCRIVGDSKIMADATGKLVTKFEIGPGCLTGHIFLYTVTISFEEKTIPVYQVLTERQDADFLIFWLSSWLRINKLKPPRQAISDQERALMLAHCRVFNGNSIKQYVDDLFSWAWDDVEKNKNPFPAATAIRIDVAHFMAAAARWECFRDKHKFRAKRFYVRAIALLVDCESVHEFQLVFLLTCFVALMPVTDYEVNLGGLNLTVEEARGRLEEYIALRGAIINNLQDYSNNEELEISPNFEALPEETKSGNKLTKTHQWIKNLITLVKPDNPEDIPGNVENALYFPPIVKELERIGKEFPLWSSAALPSAIRPNHASTASQEGYFNELKHRIFQGIKLPCSCYQFLQEHLDDIDSQQKEMKGDFTRFVHKEAQKSPTSTLPRDKPTEAPKSPPSTLPRDKPTEAPKSSPSTLPRDKPTEAPKSPTSTLPRNESTEAQKSSTATSPRRDKPEEAQKSPTSSSPRNQPEESQQNEDKENINVGSNWRQTVLDDSDFHSKMQWRGILNNQKNCLWENTNEVHERESTEFNGDTSHFYSDLIGMKTEDLCGLVEEDLFTDFDKNNNEQLSGDGGQKSKGTSPVTDEPSVIFTNDPQFSSTLTDDHLDYSPFHDSDILHDKTNMNMKDRHKSTKQCGKAPKTKKRNGYFAPYPQIKILNQPGTSIGKKGNFLPNGLHCPIVKHHGIGIKVEETCGFDSFVHILQYAALDNSAYRKALESSTNSLSKFAIEFLKHGATTANLIRRCAIMCGFYSLKTPQNSITIKPYILNVKDSLMNIWTYFYEEPIAHRSTECSNIYCSIGNTRHLRSINVNHDIICREGSKTGLENSIDVSRSWQCRKAGCDGTVQETLKCENTIFIELDIRDFVKDPTGKTRFKCKLDDMPDQLNLGETYRLVGVIDFVARDEHFVAYCRRTPGVWLQCDDMSRDCQPWLGDYEITPFGAIYIRT